MPLSEHEQKILSEMEASLSRHDRRFAKVVANTSVDTARRRRAVWGVVGFFLGFLITCLFFTQLVLVALAGVALMFVSAHCVLVNARLLDHDSRPKPTGPTH